MASSTYPDAHSEAEPEPFPPICPESWFEVACADFLRAQRGDSDSDATSPRPPAVLELLESSELAKSRAQAIVAAVMDSAAASSPSAGLLPFDVAALIVSFRPSTHAQLAPLAGPQYHDGRSARVPATISADGRSMRGAIVNRAHGNSCAVVMARVPARAAVLIALRVTGVVCCSHSSAFTAALPEGSSRVVGAEDGFQKLRVIAGFRRLPVPGREPNWSIDHNSLAPAGVALHASVCSHAPRNDRKGSKLYQVTSKGDFTSELPASAAAGEAPEDFLLQLVVDFGRDLRRSKLTSEQNPAWNVVRPLESANIGVSQLPRHINRDFYCTLKVSGLHQVSLEAFASLTHEQVDDPDCWF